MVVDRSSRVGNGSYQCLVTLDRRPRDETDVDGYRNSVSVAILLSGPCSFVVMVGSSCFPLKSAPCTPQGALDLNKSTTQLRVAIITQRSVPHRLLTMTSPKLIRDTRLYFILFYFILFYFILFYFILFYFILFYFILFYFILFYFILFYFILFYFILFYFILFYFILFYFILFYFILFYFILFYFILFYFILFYFILFYFILFYFCGTLRRSWKIFQHFYSKSLSFNMADLGGKWFSIEIGIRGSLYYCSGQLCEGNKGGTIIVTGGTTVCTS